MDESYFLKDTNDNDKIVMIFEVIEKNEAFVDGVCRTVSSWECAGDNLIVSDVEYLADVRCKFDGCTHWYFEGEDYDPNDQNDPDSYYHLCGEYCFVNHIRAMCFVWKLCYQLLEEISQTEQRCSIEEYYFENKLTVDLVNSMLNGYKIEKKG